MKVRLSVRIRKFFDRFRVRISTGIAISLLLHLLLLTLNLGLPGIGLPGLTLPWQEQSKQPSAINVEIANMAGSPPAPPKAVEAANPLEPKPLEALPSVTQPTDLPNTRVKHAPVKSASKSKRDAKALQSTPALARSEQKKGALPQEDQSAPTPAYAQQELIAVTGAHPDSFKVPPPDPDNLLRLEPPTDATPVPAQPQQTAATPAIAMQTPKQTIEQAQEPTPAVQKPSDQQSYEKPEEKKATDQAPPENSDVTLETGEHKPGDEISEQEQKNKIAEQEAAQLAADQETRRQEEARKADELAKQEATRKQAAEQAAQQAEEDAAKKREAAKKADTEAEERRIAQEAEARKQAEQVAQQQAETARKEEQRKQLLAQQAAERQAAELAQQVEAERKAAELAQKKQAEEAERQRLAAIEKQKQADELAHQKALAAERQKQQELAAQQKAQELATRQKAEVEAEAQRESARAAAAVAAAAAIAKNGAGNNPAGTGAASNPTSGNGQGNGAGNGAGNRGGGNQVNPNAPGMTAANALSQIGGMKFSDTPTGESTQHIEDTRPRSSFGINHDIVEDAYVRGWRTKIEENGDLNYSQHIKDLTREDPVVTVWIRSDGNVDKIIINRSSGRAEIDEAVIRIINVRAPYSRFPPALASKTDMIAIRRVWNFGDTLTLHEEVR